MDGTVRYADLATPTHSAAKGGTDDRLTVFLATDANIGLMAVHPW
jgi:hypothetical protein